MHRANPRKWPANQRYLMYLLNKLSRPGVGPRRFSEAEAVWRSLITTCENVASKIKEDRGSQRSVDRFAGISLDSTTEIRRLTREFIAMGMKPGENSMEFTLRTDRVMQNLTMLRQSIH